MYVIMAYDVNVERVAKVLKVGRRYLTWVQNSVLEGELTFSQYERLKTEVKKVIEEEEDSVLFYLLRSERSLEREQLGMAKSEPKWIL
ncbi:MAG: CRISPR-associated endoribonuclease Cas2 [Acetothermia bacterium 64_32]|nr:MAG: CRISPR-associated endoribonuclease Cas2 [Acetothermia bacterium 64_32]HAF69780.1 CRISPR-associated endonuclease Cas2 [Candidatus Acetothermia bacterium]